MPLQHIKENISRALLGIVQNIRNIAVLISTHVAQITKLTLNKVALNSSGVKSLYV